MLAEHLLASEATQPLGLPVEQRELPLGIQAEYGIGGGFYLIPQFLLPVSKRRVEPGVLDGGRGRGRRVHGH